MEVLYQLSYIGFIYIGFRAEDRARTGHPQLGRLMLYQMSYFRFTSFLKNSPLAEDPDLSGPPSALDPDTSGLANELLPLC
jgi:hypothetical protein